jgi:penicillin amidase
VPYDGSTTDGDWVGYIPFEELPHLYNPPDGIIVTANQRIVGTDYKYTSIGRDVAPPFRARDIYNDLTKKSKLTMDDARDAEYEVYNIPLANLAKAIVSRNAASSETIDVLKSWDGRMTIDSRGSVLVSEIRGCLANRIANDNKPVPSFVVLDRILGHAIDADDKKWLPAGVASYAQLMRACDATARTALAKRMGADPAGWTWGKIFQSRFPHPLAAAPLIGMQFATPVVPLDGSGQTPDVGSSVSMRFITSPGNWDATRHVIPLGESGDPKSPHFKDQFDNWRTGTPLIFPFSPQAVEKAAVSTTVYSPK